MRNKKYVSLLAVTGIVASLVLAVSVFAQTSPTTPTIGFFHGRAGGDHIPGVFGTVSAINGTTLTVTDTRTNTTYSVDASSATVEKNGSASSLSAISVGDTVMIQGTVNGTSVTAKTIRDGITGRGPGKNGVFGTVASINGTILTVTTKTKENSSTATTYTVDASNAKVTKNNASASVSDIAIGDTVIIQGTVSGLNVTATAIRDNPQPAQKSEANPIIQGNGQPIVGGSVTAINGTTITITNQSNVSYTIDASSAKVAKAGASASLSDIAVGDNVIVQGEINGTSVTASSITDQASPVNTQANNAPKSNGGFFGGIINFFKHFFGF